jgi:hypothetical protein
VINAVALKGFDVEPRLHGVRAMVGITDSMNLAHEGLYKELQSIARQCVAGSRWVRREDSDVS